jgi:hypothetical protein
LTLSNIEEWLERSSNKTKDTIAKVWNEFTFDEVQRVFHNWMNRFASVIESGGEHIIE